MWNSAAIDASGGPDGGWAACDAGGGDDHGDVLAVDFERGGSGGCFEGLLCEGCERGGRALDGGEIAELGQLCFKGETRSFDAGVDAAGEVGSDGDLGLDGGGVFKGRAGKDVGAEVAGDVQISGNEASQQGLGGDAGLPEDHSCRCGADGRVDDAGDMHNDVGGSDFGVGEGDEIDAGFPAHPVFEAHFCRSKVVAKDFTRIGVLAFSGGTVIGRLSERDNEVARKGWT